MGPPLAFVAAALIGFTEGATPSLQEPRNCPRTAPLLGMDVPVPAWDNNCTLFALNQSRPVTKDLNLLFLTAFSGAVGNAYTVGDHVLQMALDSLEESDLLPGYRIKVHVGDARCSEPDALAALARGLTLGPTKHGLVGPACSATSATVNDMVQYWNLLHVAPWAISNAISDPVRYPNFIRMNPSLATIIVSAYMFTRYMGWERIGIVKGTQDPSMMGFAVLLLSNVMNQEKALGTYQWTMLMNDDFSFPDLASADPMAALVAAKQQTVGVLLKVAQRDSRITIMLAYEHELVWFWCMAYHLPSQLRMKPPDRTWIVPTGWYVGGFEDKYTLGIPGFPCTSEQVFETGFGATLFSAGGWAYKETNSFMNTSNQALNDEYFAFCLNVSYLGYRPACDYGATAYIYDSVWHYAKLFHQYLIVEGNSYESLNTKSSAARLFNLSLASDYVGWSGRVRFYSPTMPGPPVNALFNGAYGDRDGDCMARQYRWPEPTQPEHLNLPKVATISSQGVPDFSSYLLWSAADEVTYRLNCSSSICDLANGWRNVDRLEMCAPGSVWSVALGCTECPAGESAAPGGTECIACPKGAFANVSGSSVCGQCSKGSSAKTFAAVECNACDAGTYADVEGMFLCEICPKGRFSAQIGATECSACPDSFPTTVSGGSREQSECTCKKDFYLSASSQACMPCMRGLDCPIGSKESLIPTSVSDPTSLLPHPKPTLGFYTKYEEPLSVYKCITEGACVGGRPEACTPNNEKLNCGFCREGTYVNLEGSCTLCADVDGYHEIYVVLFSMLAPCVILIVCWLQAREPLLTWHMPQNGAISMATVVVAYVQIIGLNALMQLELPSIMKANTENTVFAISPLKFVHPECSSVRDFGSVLSIQLLMPIYFALICAGAATLSTIINKFKPAFPTLWPNAASIYGNVYNSLYIAVAAATFQLFMCYEHPNGLQSLRSASYIICYQDQWSSLVVAAGAAILVFCIGAIALFMALLYNMPKYYANRNYRISVRFLIFKFRCGYGRWTIVLLVKGLWVTLSTVVFTEGSKQILWLNSGIITYCLLTLKVFPFRHMAVNIVDIAAHTIIVFGYNVSILWAQPQQEVLDWLGKLNAIVVMGMYPLFLGALGYQLSLWNKGRTQPEKAAEDAESLANSVIDAFVNTPAQQKELAAVIATLSIYEQNLFRSTQAIMRREWGAAGPLLEGATEPRLCDPEQKQHRDTHTNV